MSFNWIDPTEYSFNCILLMDKYIIRQICTASWHDQEYLKNLSIALAYNPVVAWYCREKTPEIASDVDKLTAAAPMGCTKKYVRKAECFILDCHDWAVVYVYPEVMNKNCSYIYNWDKERLFELTDFTDKVVLVVGDDYDREIDELEHITKNGVWILDCPGEDDRKRILRI